MGQIVAGYAISHSSMMVSQPELVEPEVRGRCYAALERVREEIAALAPDCLVVVGGDHFNNFFYDLYPQWCVGRAEEYSGWADNIPMYKATGDPILSNHIISSLLEQGFEPAFSNEMKLDHAFFGPLHFVTPKMDIPIVPVFQNTITYPLATLKRSLALGEALANAIASSPDDKRIVIIGSGGLSHWLGGPEHGRLNPEFDHEFMRRFAANDREWLTSFTDDEIIELAGNGGHEIRNWLTVRGALGNAPAESIYYDPLYPWYVGAGISHIEPETVA
ncbi:DODA-type extradiol aromatic ring-opening family dioxygenase [Novosphingobium malaysiense]|uniref:DODA-type extradiol aromatic ring-opening family dioxygenase n=1 Tax=Novosphingobium malaysiense TaxID=1348853 RepID=UPI00068FA0D3|nr:hypothetical protein [Novosphingobium malaysiense]